ncbi:MAG: RHS repeat domain-containing protein [Pirellulales bacterium]
MRHRHAGRLQKILQPDDSSITFTYDVLGSVATLTTKPDDALSTEYATQYEYDALGNVWKVHDPFNSTPTIYEYDEAGRLNTRMYPNGVKTTWSFDDRDRMLSIVHEDAIQNVIASFTYEHPKAAVGEPHRITREDGSYVVLGYDEALRLETEAYYYSPDDLVHPNGVEAHDHLHL